MAITFTRRLPLEGAVNTRDLGGWPTAEGSITSWGAFLRADEPCRLTDGDIETLRAYGITDAVDLRSSNEVAERPSLLVDAAGITAHHVPMLDHVMSGGSEPFPATLGDLYVSMIDHGAEDFAKVFRIFANAKGGVLFHCAVGKDRTGMTAMLLLKLAGVANPDILADYAASEIYLAPLLAPQIAQFEKMGIDPSLLGSRVDNMIKGLEHLDKTHGTADRFLRSGGLTKDELEAVQAKLTA